MKRTLPPQHVPFLKSREIHTLEMLKPPWWAASLLLQRMVDELVEKSQIPQIRQWWISNIFGGSRQGCGRIEVNHFDCTLVVSPKDGSQFTWERQSACLNANCKSHHS